MDALLDFAGLGEPVCGDGRCADDETHDACPGDCPICEPISPEGGIIDERDVCFEGGGDLRWLRDAYDAGWEGALIWTHTTDAAEEDNSCTWQLDFEETGRYLVEVYTDAAYAESRRAAYSVRHDGIADEIRLDQTAVDGWNELGEIDFAAGSDQWVHVGDNTGEPSETQTRLVCDAVRLTRVDLPDDGGPGGDAGPDADADVDADGDTDGDGDGDGDADGDADGGVGDGGFNRSFGEDGGCHAAGRIGQRGLPALVRLLSIVDAEGQQ
jgi:hypothetical protein